MCGRAAQTFQAATAAAQSLGVPESNRNTQRPQHRTSGSSTPAAPNAVGATEQQAELSVDNFNMSPGMDAIVIFQDNKQLTAGRKLWGIVSKGGTRATPLPTGMSIHFSSLMFNARSDTLFEKPTFSRLLAAKKTCLVAVDGFYEWKEEGKSKQPYFVYRKANDDNASDSKPYLLMPGLWTSVPTGREEDPMLTTFTIITTEVNEQLKWLHTRMPICIWDETLAREWLQSPSQQALQRMETAAKQASQFQWHAVTKEMSSMKFRTADAMKALPKLKTVDSFFLRKGQEPNIAATTTTPIKRVIALSKASESASPAKKPKHAEPTSTKGKIDHFFQRKSK